MPATPDNPSSPESQALQYILRAERSTLRDARCKAAPRPVYLIGIVGGGAMGAGIAACCVLSGFKVVVAVRNAAGQKAARNRIETILHDSLQRGLITVQQQAEFLQACKVTCNSADLANSDLVIETVIEDMQTKKNVFAMLDEQTPPETVLASNTSYLDINELARSVRDARRVIGMHFFAPAYKMKLLEIVVPDAVADDVIATAAALGRQLGKTSVLAGVCNGFIANRILAAYRQQADWLVETGAMPQDIDNAMLDFGFPMGLYAMQDLGGLDIGWLRRRDLAATGGPAERCTEVADALCELQRYGRKTGAGYYRYIGGKPQVDEVVEALIVTQRQRKRIQTRSWSGQEIMQRLLDSMQQEATLILAQGMSYSADDIDVVMVNGFGFPRERGGPMYMLENS